MSLPRRGRVLKAESVRSAEIAVPWMRTPPRARFPGASENNTDDAAARDEPHAHVEVSRCDGEIEAIQVLCVCGRRHRLELIEPDSSEPPVTPDSPRPAAPAVPPSGKPKPKPKKPEEGE